MHGRRPQAALPVVILAGLARLLAGLPAGLLAGSLACAQTLPPPSRTVYKCENEGKVHYSDSPCLGATKLEVEPTRGLDSSTGRVRQGQDVARERTREQMAEALRPLTGMDARQIDQAGRRQLLPPAAQRLCRQLDAQLTLAEARERKAQSAAELKAAQQQLFELRTAFHKGSCL